MKVPAIVSFLWESQLGALREFFQLYGPHTVVTLTPYVSQTLIDIVSQAGGRIYVLDQELGDVGAQVARSEWEPLRDLYEQHLEEALPTILSEEDGGTLRQVIGTRLDEELPALMILLHGLELAQKEHQLWLVIGSEDVLPLSKVAMHWARTQGISSIHLSHAIALNDPYTVHGQLVADIHAVYGQRGLEGYLDYGVPAERMRITGNPAWDKFAKLAGERLIHEGELRRKYELRSGEPIVVFGTTWASNLTALGDEGIFGQTVGAFIDACETLFRAGLRFNPIIKDRPPNYNFGERRCKELLVERGADSQRYFYQVEDGPLWAACADVLVAVDSNYCVEALLCGTPAINLQHPANTLLGPCYGAQDGVLDVEAKELANAIRLLLVDEVLREKQQELASRSLQYFNIGNDGLASVRVATLLREIAEQSGVERYLPDSEYDQRPLKQSLSTTGESFGTMSGAGGVVEAWLNARRPDDVQKRLIDRYLADNHDGPRIGVVVLDLVGDLSAISATVGSIVERQLYRNMQVQVLTVGDFESVVNVEHDRYVVALNQAMAGLDCDWCLMVMAGELLTASGLLITALELIAAPQCRAIYADEILVTENNEQQALLRPDFNLDLLLSFPAAIAKHWLFRRDVFLEMGGFDSTYSLSLEFELVLRLIEQAGLDGLGHVSEPLVVSPALKLEVNEDEQKAIARHLEKRGYLDAVAEGIRPGRYQLLYGHIDLPGVTIVIPALAPLAKLQRCVESVLENTQNVPFELLLLARDSQGDDVDRWLDGMRKLGEVNLRVLDRAADQVLAVAQNFAGSEARGDYLLFLAADSVVVQANWLEMLLNHAQRPEVGPVGAKLVKTDGTISHAGLILGLEGPVGSPFLGEGLNASGYMNRLEVDQNYSAVTGDCLMIARGTFQQLHGFDESLEALRWSDVDLCLKARQAGFLTVWSPHVVLMKESQREGLSPTEQDALYRRWLPQLARDPAYNANLSLVQRGGFKLTDNAISWRPLQSWRPLPTVLAHQADMQGCGHYRIIQPFIAMKQQALIDGALSRGLMHVPDLERYDPDAIVLQRQVGEDRIQAMQRMKSFSRAFKVYELDDYLPNLPVKNAHRRHMPNDILRTLRRGLGFVDRFVVSTDALADAFAGLHDDIRVVKNRLPTHWWLGLESERRVSIRPRVGWAGGASHTGDLEMIADVVRELADEVDWVFFGMCPEKLRPYIREYHQGVQIDRYPAALAKLNLDLAIAPVEQNLFNECKSNLRLLEYGACGFPVICSDIRCYQDDAFPVTRVKNRYKDWVDAIRMHVADMDATARMGDELQKIVLRDWMLRGEHLDAWARAWLPD